MLKPAKTEHPGPPTWLQIAGVHAHFLTNQSRQEALRSLFEAARWAPSSNNEQPWAFIVATKDDPADFHKALSVLGGFQPVLGQSMRL